MALVVGGLLGWLIAIPTVRLRGDYLAIVTLGFGEIVRLFMNNLDRPVNLTNGPQGINLIDPIISLQQPLQLFGVRITAVYFYYYLFLVLAGTVVFVSIRLLCAGFDAEAVRAPLPLQAKVRFPGSS